MNKIPDLAGVGWGGEVARVLKFNAELWVSISLSFASI